MNNCFPGRRANTMAAADRACPNATCHCFLGVWGGRTEGGHETEVFVPSVLFVGFLILSSRPYCARVPCLPCLPPPPHTHTIITPAWPLASQQHCVLNENHRRRDYVLCSIQAYCIGILYRRYRCVSLSVYDDVLTQHLFLFFIFLLIVNYMRHYFG